ncbi:hypothetical protein JHK87_006310 [Glycine soja]|nr:hypothetical protein JHK87_006310 [Glycine soja]
MGPPDSDNLIRLDLVGKLVQQGNTKHTRTIRITEQLRKMAGRVVVANGNLNPNNTRGKTITCKGTYHQNSIIHYSDHTLAKNAHQILSHSS